MRTNSEIIKVLSNLKEQQQISLSELARQVGMAKSALSRYFNETREFPINNVDAFAKALHTTPEYILGFNQKENIIVSDSDRELLKINHQLTPDRQQNVYTYADNQLKEQQAGNVIAIPTPDDNFAEVSADGVLSAGVGEWLDGTDSGFMVKVKKPLPDSYDYVFQINGHSMEPYFKDKQVVFAEEHEEYRNGQIVAAIVDGNAYLKRLDCDGDMMTLESLNPEYPNINVFEDDDYKILGVVFA